MARSGPTGGPGLLRGGEETLAHSSTGPLPTAGNSGSSRGKNYLGSEDHSGKKEDDGRHHLVPRAVDVSAVYTPVRENIIAASERVSVALFVFSVRPA